MRTKWIEIFIIVMALSLLSFCFAGWDNDKPADNQPWNAAAASIRANNDALEAVLGVDLDMADIIVGGPYIDVRSYTDFAAAITAISTDSNSLLISNSQAVTDDITVPSNVSLIFLQGGMLNISSTKVVTLQGTIIAGNYQIFTGAGFVDTRYLPSPNNVCWYPGSSLNDKWDAMVNEWPSAQIYHGKIIYVPPAIRGDPGTINYGTDDKYTAWKLDGTLNIDGKCNASTIIFDGDLRVETGAGLTNAVVISETDKIENVIFPNGLWVECNNEATNGLVIKGGARIQFFGEIHILKSTNGVVIEASSFDCTEIHIDKIYIGTWSGSAVKLTGGTAKSVGFSRIKDIVAQVTSGASCKVLEIAGRVPDFTIDRIYASKSGAANNIDIGIHIKTSASGAPAYYRSNIGSAYLDFTTTAIKTEDTTSGVAVKIRGLDIGPIWAGNCTTFADLGYLQECRLDIFDYDDLITVGSDCQDIRLITSKGVATNITDNGVRTRINGVGSESANAETPTAANWEVGEVVDFTDSGDASGNGVYIKLPDASWSKLGT